MKRILVEISRDLLWIAGASSIAFGAFQAWPPAGWMVGGLAAMVLARGLAPTDRSPSGEVAPG
jgi:hypothetical protein